MVSTSIWRVFGPALIISIAGSFHTGYQSIVVNPTETVFKHFINKSTHAHYGSFVSDIAWNYLWPTVVNTQMIGGLIGTFFVKYLSEKWGRKRSFYITNSVIIGAAALQAGSKLTNFWELFFIGRLLTGVSQGVHLGVQPVYFNEISPKSQRGVIGSLTGFALEFGFLISSLVSLPMVLGGDTTWPYLFVVEAAPSFIALIFLPFLHESPKFLASRGDYTAAKKSLHFFGRTETETKQELEEITKELESHTANEKAAMSLRMIFSIPHIRKGVLIGWLVNFSSYFSGIVALSYFSTTILEGSGLSERDAQIATIGITAPACVGAFLAGFVMDRFGRRPILLVSYTALLALNILFIIFANLSRVHGIAWAAYPNVAVASLISLAFGVGPANIAYFLTSELVPQRARSTAHMWSMIMQRCSAGLAALIFYPLNKVIHEFCFLLHIVPVLATIICVVVVMPETKNKSTLEIMGRLGYKEDKRIELEKCL